MTTSEYQAYQTAVANFLARNQVKPGCHSPADHESEPFLTWRPCECCGSKLIGNRETYNFAHTDTSGTTNTFQADICADCAYYLEYGQLDDMTMLDMDIAS